MDKVAIISDMHGSLVALENVLEDIDRRGIKHIYCLGDLVAKGPEPQETIECIKKRCEVVVKGNCDETVSIKPHTKEHLWNREMVGEKNLEYLKTLPLDYTFYMSGLKIKLMHSGSKDLYNSIKYYDIDNTFNSQIDELLKDAPDVLIFGHIHSPMLCIKNSKMLVNSGSVANACDIMYDKEGLKQLSSYLILEGELNSKEVSSISYEIVKIPYDYKKEIENLKNTDMPNKEMAIKELLTGKYVKR